MTITFPNETPEYRAARQALLEREIRLRREMEAVAELRRQLPQGGLVQTHYVFDEALPDGTVRQVTLGDLFTPGTSALAIYHFMFPRYSTDTRIAPTSGETARLSLEETPCPSCTALLDQLDGAALHIAQRMSFVIMAKTSATRLATFGRERGWKHMRLVSSASNSFNRDYHGEIEGGQQPMLNVFERDGDTIRHFWGSELLYAPTDPGQDMRHVGTLEPLWNMFDFTRAGRPTDWDEQHDYSCCHRPDGEGQLTDSGPRRAGGRRTQS